jgi:hypothetical protein
VNKIAHAASARARAAAAVCMCARIPASSLKSLSLTHRGSPLPLSNAKRARRARRALQLPPEAWLRFCPFNCSLTYLTIRPTGSVSCRLLGDVGHLPYDMVTFSKHRGYNW